MLSDLSHTPKPGGRFALAEGLVLAVWANEATAAVYCASTASTHLVTAWAAQLLRDVEARGDCEVPSDSEVGEQPELMPAAAASQAHLVQPAVTEAETEPELSRETVDQLQTQTLDGLLRAGLIRRLP